MSDNEQIAFPAIRSKTDRVSIINNSQESAGYMHSRFSYAQAAKVNLNREREARNAKDSMERHNEMIKDFNYIDNTPRSSIINPFKTSAAERLTSEAIRAKDDELNSIFKLKSIQAENALVEMKSRLNEFMNNWGQGNLSSSQRADLNKIRSDIDSRLINLDTLEVSQSGPKICIQSRY